MRITMGTGSLARGWSGWGVV